MTADDITTAVSPEDNNPAEPTGDTQTSDPTEPQPECVTCHGQGSPTVQEAVDQLRELARQQNVAFGANGFSETVNTVLEALEKHHQ